MLTTLRVAPTKSVCCPLPSNTPVGVGELVKLSTTILFEELSVSKTDAGKEMAKVALGSPVTSNEAGVPVAAEFNVVPPVAVRVPSGDITTVPDVAPAAISPKARPLVVVIPRTVMIVADTFAVATAACVGA